MKVRDCLKAFGFHVPSYGSIFAIVGGELVPCESWHGGHGATYLTVTLPKDGSPAIVTSMADRDEVFFRGCKTFGDLRRLMHLLDDTLALPGDVGDFHDDWFSSRTMVLRDDEVPV